MSSGSVTLPSPSGITSINGDTTAAQVIAAGTGISVATVAGTTTVASTSSFSAGNLTDVGTDGITISGGTSAVNGAGTSISQHVADSTHNGYLSSTDWSTFNSKQAAGSYITALTGDVTASGPGSAAATLASVGTAGTYVKVTTDSKGRITSGSTTPQAIADGGTNSTAALNNSRAMISSGGAIVEAATTSTEIGYVNGVTSAIQTQLDAKLCPTQVISVSSNVTLTNKAIHLVSTAAARSLTLPSPSSSLYIVLKDSTGGAATNNVTLVRPGSQKIDTVAASYVANTTLFSLTIVSDGTDYFLI